MTFEFDGKKYSKASVHQKEWGNRIISELRFRGNEHILDLGCGDGALTQSLAALVPAGNVIGIDASTGMINTAQEKETENLTFLQMDIDSIQLDDKFDLIFSNAALHWISDHKRLWDSITELLKPNGIVRCNFAADGNCMNFFSVIRQMMNKEEYREYFAQFIWPWYMPPLEEYKGILKNHPFREVRIKGENADRLFPDKDAIIGWIDQPSLVAFLEHIPEDKKGGFREEVIKKMLDLTLQEDGRCFETFRRIDVFARKIPNPENTEKGIAFLHGALQKG